MFLFEIIIFTQDFWRHFFLANKLYQIFNGNIFYQSRKYLKSNKNLWIYVDVFEMMMNMFLSILTLELRCQKKIYAIH